MSLYAKLSIVLLAFFVVVGSLNFWLTLHTTGLYEEEVTQRLNRNLAATIAREKPVVRDGWIDRAVLNGVFDALMAVNPSIEIYLLDERGKILAFSAPPGKVRRNSVSLTPIRRFLAGERLPILGDDPRDPSREKIFSATALPAIHGYLYVILGGEQFDSAMEQIRASWILQESGALGAGAILFALAAALLLFAAMTRRLRALADAMDSFRRTELAGEAPAPGGGDEVDQLAETFREMSGRMALQVKQLRELDVHRRELVANVSHDLRTPLASLQGYLDTLLLKEAQLTPDETRRFLEIAARHSARLGKLIDELFELAKLDSQVMPIRVEPFSMGELAQDVVQKFHLRAEQAGVRLAAELRPEVPLVSGDLALIERVLENLIENAIRYTPAGGEIVVFVGAEPRGAAVEVRDTGTGIAEDRLPFIFDRFWKGEDSTPRGGAGLGLAIARRILELHGATLSVTSKVHEGTSFRFGLREAA